MFAPEQAAPTTIKLDPIELLTHASGPVKLTVGILLVASTLVWLVAALKLLQLGRWRSAERAFEADALRAGSASELFAIAQQHRGSPGGRVVGWLEMRGAHGSPERLRAIAERAIVTERARVSSLVSILATTASVSPFVGLFGTVYGIIDAFVRIGAEKSASLPVVAPAIGEALIATAIGLAAAIPAVVFYNMVDKRIADLETELEASAEEWVHTLADAPSYPDTQANPYPPAMSRRA